MSVIMWVLCAISLQKTSVGGYVATDDEWALINGAPHTNLCINWLSFLSRVERQAVMLGISTASPPIKPDVRFSRIRLSCNLSTAAPSGLGAATQLLSQTGEFQRHAPIQFLNRFQREQCLLSHTRMFLHPIGAPFLLLSVTTVRPLRSTGITPLPHYYGPLRLPSRTTSRFSIPEGVGGGPLLSSWTAQVSARPDGPPRFLDRPVRTRRPLSPRGLRWVHAPVASPPIAGFRRPVSLAIPHLCNEAESGSLALRLMHSSHGASTLGLLLTPPV